MDVIKRMLAWEALDSRGTPTVGCSIGLESGAEGQAIVPSGVSTGSHEAHERRDGGERYWGKGVRDAVKTLKAEVAPVLVGCDAHDQQGIDNALRTLDRTDDLRRVGANAVLAVSVACALAAAESHRQPLWRVFNPARSPLLPMPMVNIISGGAHAGALIDIQDFLAVPVGAASFSQAMEWASRARAGTADELRARGHDTALVADEGGLAAQLPSNRTALEVLTTGIERSGLAPGDQVAIAIDVAATQLVSGSGYRLERERRTLSAEALIEEFSSWLDDFAIVSIEDPVAEDDHDGWELATHTLTDRVQLVGDDLFATSPDRLRAGIREQIANAVLVKPNQVGTLSDAWLVTETAQQAGYATVISARSGDTEDAWLADLAVGWRAGQIKVGSTTRSERTAKWNRLLRLEAENADATLAPWPAVTTTHGQRAQRPGVRLPDPEM